MRSPRLLTIVGPVRTGAAHAAWRVGRWLRRRDAFRQEDALPMEMRLVRLEELGLADEHRVAHVPSFWKTLPRILPREEVTSEDVLLDLGSGMGRMVVFAAAQYPFRRVIGVEIASELHEIAERNVERNRGRLRSEVELVNADVLDYQMPDDVTVVYLYNPFSGPIFDHFVRELERSVQRRPRNVRIVYLTPREEKRLLSCKQVELIRSARAVRGDRSDNSIVRLYRLQPAAPAGRG